jgi:hypothetical protein
VEGSGRENDNYRSKTIEHVDPYLKPDFAYLPDNLKDPLTESAEPIYCCIISLGLNLDHGAGKRSLIKRFKANVEGSELVRNWDEYLPEEDDMCLKTVGKNGKVFLDIVGTSIFVV